jgi:hypothetical protein
MSRQGTGHFLVGMAYPLRQVARRKLMMHPDRFLLFFWRLSVYLVLARYQQCQCACNEYVPMRYTSGQLHKWSIDR